jgi:hypothetical protein
MKSMRWSRTCRQVGNALTNTAIINPFLYNIIWPKPPRKTG